MVVLLVIADNSETNARAIDILDQSMTMFLGHSCILASGNVVNSYTAVPFMGKSKDPVDR